MKIVVDVYKHERGWGMRLFHTEEFDMSEFGMKRALKYQKDTNAQNNLKVVPDVYYKAHDPRVVE